MEEEEDEMNFTSIKSYNSFNELVSRVDGRNIIFQVMSPETLISLQATTLCEICWKKWCRQ
jgi:hypothetical protein